mmetsp:Transcript_27314/g.40460  ORF Transcript_27314/g.40460 Transcript_27314/m.40460 type:complete len:229 (+) Transcript_27314:32-718(+)
MPLQSSIKYISIQNQIFFDSHSITYRSIITRLTNLSKRNTHSSSHGLVHLHINLCLGSSKGSSLGSRESSLCLFECGSYSSRINIINLDRLGTRDISGGISMGNRETSCNKVLLRVTCPLMQNLQYTRLQLCNKRNMVSSDSILSRRTGNNDLINVGTRINGFMGKTEVEGHTGLCSFFNGGEGTAECGGEAAKECSLHHVGKRVKVDLVEWNGMELEWQSRAEQAAR